MLGHTAAGLAAVRWRLRQLENQVISEAEESRIGRVPIAQVWSLLIARGITGRAQVRVAEVVAVGEALVGAALVVADARLPPP